MVNIARPHIIKPVSSKIVNFIENRNKPSEKTLPQMPLHSMHVALGAEMAPLAGWELPMQFSNKEDEVAAVRSHAGIFDISFLGRVYVSGPQAPELMDWVMTASASNMRVGRARYTLMVNEEGGIMEDMVFFRMAEDRYLLVLNTGNHEKVVSWIQHWIDEKFPGAALDDQTDNTVQMALQGPNAAVILDQFCIFEGDKNPSAMKRFSWKEGMILGKRAFVSRTGYTGEDGFELIMEAEDAEHIWRSLLEREVVACGMLAHDILGLEAGLPHYGSEIDESTTPIEAGLEKFVRFDEQFVGSDALMKQREQGPNKMLIGLKASSDFAPRPGDRILHKGVKVGRVASATYSPTLNANIAMAYVAADYATESDFELDATGDIVQALKTSTPFYARSAPKQMRRELLKVAA